MGVSTALVSYVLNGKEKEARVSARMVNKIRQAVIDLKYKPNMIAKSLKSGKTNTIGLIVADISNPFFSNIARIIEDEAKRQGYVVIFGSSDENDKKQADLIEVFLNRQVDAFILSPAAGTEEQINALKTKGIPVVLIDRYFNGVDVDAVHINNYQATNKAVNHLIANGRSKIAMVSYTHPMTHMKDRVSGYLDAMRDHGIRVKKEWRIEAAYADLNKDMDSKLTKLLKPLSIDAIMFASNSLTAAGLKRVVQFGIKVPDELAIISFDETEIFDFFYSPVTYVSQSIAEIGKDAVQLAASRIQKHQSKTQRIIVDSKLVIRKSCGGKRSR